MAASTALRPGLALLQRCGMAVWAQTCSSACPPSGLPVRRPVDQACSGAPASPLVLADTVREQVTQVLASIVAFHQQGGDHERTGPCVHAPVAVTAG